MLQINRYLLKRLIKSSFAIMGGLTLIMLTVQIIAQNDLLIKGTVNFLQLILISLLSLSEFTLFLLIIGFITAVRLTLTQASQDNEWVIFQVGGYSRRQLLLPFYQMLLLVLLVGYGFSLFLVPEALYLQKQKLHQYKNQALRTQLVTGRFYEPEENLIFHISKADHPKGLLYDIYMADNRTAPAYILTAKQGQFWQTEQGTKIQFLSGSYYYLAKNLKQKKDKDLNYVDFAELWIDIEGIASDNSRADDNEQIIRRQLKILKTNTLWYFAKGNVKKNEASLLQATYNPKLQRDYQLQLHQRFNMPLLAVSLLGFMLCLPVPASNRQRASGFKRYAQMFSMIGISIGLIFMHLIFINSPAHMLRISAYILPVLMLGLPFYQASRKQKS